MDSTEKMLLSLGLAKSETKLYLFGLEHGAQTAEDVISATKLKAPTVYHALSQLESKGLVKRQRSEGRLIYSFEPASRLQSLIHLEHARLRQQAEALEQMLPLFPKLREGAPGHRVLSFTGHEQVRQAIDQALFCASKQWDILAPVDNYIAGSDKAYISYFKDMRIRNDIQSRSLWEDKVGKEPLQLSDLVTRKPRYLPDRYRGKFKAMMIIFENKTLLVGSPKQPVAQLIDAQEFTDMMRILFDALWRTGQKER